MTPSMMEPTAKLMDREMAILIMNRMSILNSIITQTTGN